jgi:hypothetical protein
MRIPSSTPSHVLIITIWDVIFFPGVNSVAFVHLCWFQVQHCRTSSASDRSVQEVQAGFLELSQFTISGAGSGTTADHRDD